MYSLEKTLFISCVKTVESFSNTCLKNAGFKQLVSGVWLVVKKSWFFNKTNHIFYSISAQLIYSFSICYLRVLHGFHKAYY